MTKEFDKGTHPGNFPVRVLRHNITSHFESVREGAFKQIEDGVKSGKFIPVFKSK